MFPSPLKLPPETVTEAASGEPKVAVGSDFTVTAASATEEVIAATTAAATVSRRDFLILVPFAIRASRFGRVERARGGLAAPLPSLAGARGGASANQLG